MSKQPTNYADIRESVALALDAKTPEAKDAVLQTLDDAVANHPHHPYSVKPVSNTILQINALE